MITDPFVMRLGALLQPYDDIQIVGEAINGIGPLSAARVLHDTHMPAIIDAAKRSRIMGRCSEYRAVGD